MSACVCVIREQAGSPGRLFLCGAQNALGRPRLLMSDERARECVIREQARRVAWALRFFPVRCTEFQCPRTPELLIGSMVRLAESAAVSKKNVTATTSTSARVLI